MKVEEIAEAADARISVGSDAEIKCFYSGDFLSRVMGNAPSDSCWITVMNNVNVAGVAVLAEIRAVLLCEGVEPSAELKDRCERENIALLVTELPAFECCRKLGRL